MAEKVRPWSPPQIALSVLAGVIVWSAIGFSWFGHGFDWQTKGAAMRASDDAVVESMASICVAQARGGMNADSKLKEFAALDTWKQQSFVEEAKWAIMPGSDSARSGVADLCATQLRTTS